VPFLKSYVQFFCINFSNEPPTLMKSCETDNKVLKVNSIHPNDQTISQPLCRVECNRLTIYSLL